MAMPKGHKIETGYSTSKSLGGDSYHTISDKMSEMGHKMNHSTARNVFVNALKKIAKQVTNMYDIECDEKELMRIAKDPRFQQPDEVAQDNNKQSSLRYSYSYL